MSPKAPLNFQPFDYKDFMRGHFKINETIRNYLSRSELKIICPMMRCLARAHKMTFKNAKPAGNLSEDGKA